MCSCCKPGSVHSEQLRVPCTGTRHGCHMNKHILVNIAYWELKHQTQKKFHGRGQSTWLQSAGTHLRAFHPVQEFCCRWISSSSAPLATEPPSLLLRTWGLPFKSTTSLPWLLSVSPAQMMSFVRWWIAMKSSTSKTIRWHSYTTINQCREIWVSEVEGHMLLAQQVSPHT